MKKAAFRGPGARRALHMEASLQRVITDWSKKFLIDLTNRFLRSKGVVGKAGMKGTKEELKRVLTSWFVKQYQSDYKAETGSAAVGVPLKHVQEQAIYQAERTAKSTYSKLQAEFYDSTRKFMGKINAHAKRTGIEPSTAWIARQLRGLPGPDPWERAGKPRAPSYRFRGQKLRTFGSNGINGSADPFMVAARARVIARTELTQARNEGKLDAFKETGAPFIMWSSFQDDRARRGHKELDGKVIRTGGFFKWVGENGESVQARAPGDMSLPVGERVNCRCAIITATESEYLAQHGGEK